ncbi:GNAT family N-acetyltransferase [Nocardioides astragali]|uniref:GNAT family N-acetyltransferase n=1 Tax=Nocardioides astragali TaxID=1776736 RepID=A0ABW2NBD9_9ACTN|nr:GNAT family N-acetyltransferase [Nocardioides astragali]
MTPGQQAPALDVLTSDGRPARIRAVADTDRDGLLVLHEEMDAETQRLRFFTVSKTAGRHYVDHVLAHDPTTIASLVATVSGDIVGLATAERMSDDTAEVALLVARSERGHGLGTLLLENLAAACRQLGIRRFVADVLPENSRMSQVLRDAGYTIERNIEPGVMTYELSTEASETARRATETRRRLAEARSLERVGLTTALIDPLRMRRCRR